MSRIRRTRALLRLLVATSLLALSAVAVTGAADAAKKKRSCKKNKEQKGCKLPVAATYLAQLKGGGAISIYVADKTTNVSINAREENRFTAGCEPSVDRAVVVINKRVKVGKTYKLSSKRATPFSWNNVKGKVKIKSAKKATFSGTYVSHTKDPQTRKETNVVRCQRSLKASGKRGGT